MSYAHTDRITRPRGKVATKQHDNTTNLHKWTWAASNSELQVRLEKDGGGRARQRYNWSVARSVDHVGFGVLIPWKYVGGVRVCFNPLKCQIFHSELLLDNSTCFTSRTKDLCQKWTVKLIFRGAWNSLMSWPDWPHPTFYDRSTPLSVAHDPLEN